MSEYGGFAESALSHPGIIRSPPGYGPFSPSGTHRNTPVQYARLPGLPDIPGLIHRQDYRSVSANNPFGTPAFRHYHPELGSFASLGYVTNSGHLTHPSEVSLIHLWLYSRDKADPF
jgi:hypothetical protein